MGGAQNVMSLMEQLGRPTPKIFKKIDGNPSEMERVNENFNIKDNLFNIGEGDCFQISSDKIELKLKVIETPGHLSDHLCYLLHEKSKGQT